MLLCMTCQGKQVLGLVVAVALAIVFGLITGVITRLVCPPLIELFEDKEFWLVEDGGLTSADLR